MTSFLFSSHFSAMFVKHELLVFTVLQAFKKVLISIQLWSMKRKHWGTTIYESTI